MVVTVHYDVAVIGSGQGGGPLANAFAQAGRKTVLIEREHVGGTCINEGCTPTKTMVASARVAYLARRGADYGVHTGTVTVDLAKVRERKRAIVESFRSGSERRTRATEGLDLLMGEGRFTGAKSLEVRLNEGGTVQITAATICINVGARPTIPDLPGLDSVRYLTSTSIMELDTVPEHLLVLGGGYIGLEFGQMFRRFGSAVTIVQRGERLLGREDADVADEVAKILREDGIDVLLNTSALSVEKRGDEIALTVVTPEGERVLVGDQLLVAVGRTPNSAALNPEAAGLALDKAGYIMVNERLETNVSGIYALGDVKPGPAFTHIAYDDFRILRTNLLEAGNRTTANRDVPYTAFIDPQLARIGMSEEEARRSGRPIRVAKMPMSWVARALEVDETRGLMKAIVDTESGKILGATVLGIEGGELMSMMQIAMMGGLHYTVLKDATLAHPTLAESLNNLFSNFTE